MPSGVGFERMVIGLPQSVADHTSVGAAVDLAERLRIELFAAFVADTGSYALAGSTLAREFCILDLRWQPIERARFLQDLELRADLARQHFAESTKNRNLNARFDVFSRSWWKPVSSNGCRERSRGVHATVLSKGWTKALRLDVERAVRRSRRRMSRPGTEPPRTPRWPPHLCLP